MWPIFLLWLAGGSPTADAPGNSLLVSAAVSLIEALSECGPAFTKATGITVRFNFGPSNALARQIVQGAPVDVFVSADAAQMDIAVRAGAVDRRSVTTIGTNTLVVVVPSSAGRRWTGPEQLASATVRRIATGDSNAVPAGVYAKLWLERIGMWSALRGKIVPTSSVRGALAAVRTGAADAGIVYRTDAQAVGGTTVVLEVTGRDAPNIEYAAGIVLRSTRPAEARQFIEFLRGPAARRILQHHGFGPVSALTLR